MSLSTSSMAPPSQDLTGSRPIRPRSLWLILAVASLICGTSTSAFANEPQIETVQKGDPAPYTGDLFPVGASVRLAMELDYCDQRKRFELEHAQAVCDNERHVYLEVSDAEARAQQQRIRLLEQQLESAMAWYKSPLFVSLVAATVSVGLLVTAAVVVSAVPEAVR